MYQWTEHYVYGFNEKLKLAQCLYMYMVCLN